MRQSRAVDSFRRHPAPLTPVGARVINAYPDADGHAAVADVYRAAATAAGRVIITSRYRLHFIGSHMSDRSASRPTSSSMRRALRRARDGAALDVTEAGVLLQAAGQAR